MLLRHFRPRPAFATSLGGKEGSIHQQRKRLSRKHPRGYSYVEYDAAHNKITLSYLHSCLHVSPITNRDEHPLIIFLVFELSVSPRVVKCIYCSASDRSTSDLINARMDHICSNELPGVNSSLFSVVSCLLQLLNGNILNAYHSTRGETFYQLIRRSHTTNPVNTFHLLDLQILLLRCSATGRTRSQTLSPLPAEFSSIKGDDVLARIVFSASNELYLRGFRTVRMEQENQHQSTDTWLLLSFLVSLPIKNGSLLNVDIDNTMANSDSKKRQGHIDAKLTLELDTYCPTPSFLELAEKYGTIQAYHGTKIEYAWSILNYGLFNLSYNKALSQNGAMMGDGIYVSSSRQVAENFAVMAAERTSPLLPYALEHESLLHLLSYANVNVAKLDPLDTYDIRCLAVFEATIIQPPHHNTEEFDERITRQEGKYFVCENDEFVRISKLHLTFELSKKVKWMPRGIPLSLVVLLIALVWVFSL